MSASAFCIAGENATKRSDRAAQFGQAWLVRHCAPIRFGDDILDHAGNQAAHGLVHAARRLEAGPLPVDFAHDVADDADRGDVVERE